MIKTTTSRKPVPAPNSKESARNAPLASTRGGKLLAKRLAASDDDDDFDDDDLSFDEMDDLDDEDDTLDYDEQPMSKYAGKGLGFAAKSPATARGREVTSVAPQRTAAATKPAGKPSDLTSILYMDDAEFERMYAPVCSTSARP
jgi:hypothetical protein